MVPEGVTDDINEEEASNAVEEAEAARNRREGVA